MPSARRVFKLRFSPGALLLCWGALFTGAASADTVIFRGKVTMEDGSPPGKTVSIERVCEGLDHIVREGVASAKTGEFVVQLDLGDYGQAFQSTGNFTLLPCSLQAVLSGFASNQLDLTDIHITSNPRLPTLVLRPASKAMALAGTENPAPFAARRPWAAALKQLTARNWAAAEDPLREAVKAAPKFAVAWATLGTLCENLGKPEDAHQALERAIELDPKSLPLRLTLTNAQIELKDWPAAAATAQTLIDLDRKNQFVEAHLQKAIALYQLKDFDGALTNINDAIRLDKKGELPRAEYVLGVILEAKHDYDSAAEHLRNYVLKNPHARDVAKVSEHIPKIGKPDAAELSMEISPLDLRLTAVGEAPVPGGIRAFSAIAQLKNTPSNQDFFLEYSRAILAGGPGGNNATREAGDAIRAYIASLAQLEAIGENRGDSTLIRLAVNNDEQVRRSQNILALLGWKLVPKGDSFSVEPGDQQVDGFRQWVLAALGVDELDLRHAMEAKRPFEFAIPKETARLIGGAAWGVILKGAPDIAGGPVEVFLKDWRFARVYAGLGSIPPDSAAALVSAVGLGNLIAKYSALTADYAPALVVADKQVAVPGGEKAQPVWARLAGANPQTPAPFLRALFEKDQGRLLAFYFDLVHADTAHQQYFTATPERAEAYFKWYRESAGPAGLPKTEERWQAAILQKLRLDASGKIIFPGGRDTWAKGSESDDEVLLRHAPTEALAGMALLEEKRGTPLNPDAARLLAQHYDQWRSLFSYFEKLPGLQAAEFQALADFADQAAKAPVSRQNLLVGEWHSLVKLMVLGTEAGSLDSAQGAQAFRQVCQGLQSENPSSQAIAAVRAMTGGAGDVDEALASRLLRLSGAPRAAFESVKVLQHVPRIGSLTEPPDAAKTLAALSGAVYAALLDPAYLLVAEDPLLLSKHSFVPLSENPPSGLFAHSALLMSNSPPGSNFVGGFGAFQQVAQTLNQRTVGQLQTARDGLATAALEPAPVGLSAKPDGPSVPADELIFRAGGRLVEVYATVTDKRGRYVDDLSANQFSIVEDGRPKGVFAFENHTSGVSVALVFDTTGSMTAALPPLKNAAMRLVDELRPTDSVAVYSFNDTVTELQSFTSDKEAAKRAILKTHAAGITALYDALVRVNHDLSARTGKKVIVVFTDGSDNASMLTADAAVERAKARGIPIYTIAEGEALLHPKLLQELGNMSQATGGTPFLIRKLSDIGGVFEKMSQDLLHGYLVAFQPDPGDNHVWRKIEVVVNGPKGLQIRAREGFYVE
jgi:VWFA-related protein